MISQSTPIHHTMLLVPIWLNGCPRRPHPISPARFTACYLYLKKCEHLIRRLSQPQRHGVSSEEAQYWAFRTQQGSAQTCVVGPDLVVQSLRKRSPRAFKVHIITSTYPPLPCEMHNTFHAPSRLSTHRISTRSFSRRFTSDKATEVWLRQLHAGYGESS